MRRLFRGVLPAQHAWQAVVLVLLLQKNADLTIHGHGAETALCRQSWLEIKQRQFANHQSDPAIA